MQDIQNQIMSLNGLVKRSQCESSSLTLKKNLEKIREVGENIQSNLIMSRSTRTWVKERRAGSA